jgi:hypothetical protein
MNGARSLAVCALVALGSTGACTGPASEPARASAFDGGAGAAVPAPLVGVDASAAPTSNEAPGVPDAGEVGGPASLTVPRVARAIVPTGRFRVQIWAEAANTHTLLEADGKGAVPMNEARFLWDSGHLYVFFYGGDLDLEAHQTKHDGPVWNDDSIALVFPQPDGSKRFIQISITNVVADGICPADATTLSDARCDLRWESGVRAATDADGTFNKIGDNDEEWAIEASVPLAAIGVSAPAAGARIPFEVRRCEIQHDGPHSCGAWGEEPSGVLVLGG